MTLATIFETILHPKLSAWKRLVTDYADSGAEVVPPAEELAGYGRLATDFIVDRDNRRKRKQAIAGLTEADKLDKQAEKIVVPKPVDQGALPVTNFSTVGELYMALQAVEHGSSLAPIEKMQRQALRSEATSIRQAASIMLGETGDPQHGEKAASVKSQINGQQTLVAQAEESIEILDKLAEVVAHLDELARGQRRSTDPSWPIKALEKEIEKKLATFPPRTREEGERAKKSIVRAQAKILTLQDELAALLKAGRELDCQRWSEPR